MKPIAIRGCGMVTGVGLNAAASCAAMRCGINLFAETRFMGRGGEWLIGSMVPLDQKWRGRAKLVQLVTPALRECFAAAGSVKPDRIPVLLCVAEPTRPGRFDGLEEGLLPELEAALGLRLHSRSAIVAQGKVGGRAVEMAGKLIHDEQMPGCIVAGVDTFLVAGTIAAYQEKNRLLNAENSNGFIPGEAAAAVLLGPAGNSGSSELLCMGVGFGQEKATIDSEDPQRADGLVQALKAVVADSGRTLDDVGYRITDLNGEQYSFKEATLAIARTVRKVKPVFDIWHPVDCIGEIGAAIVPCVLGIALAATRKGYAPAPGVLCHFANDDGQRAALILRPEEGRAA